MRRSIEHRYIGLVFILTGLLWANGAMAAEPLKLVERSRKAIGDDAKLTEVIEKPAEWNPAETALVICDMWDAHWCKSATKRTGQLAPRINQLAKSLREKGSLIIHAPSNTMEFYEGTPQRQRATAAPAVKPPSAAGKIPGPPLPIDDTDNGCDDEPQCTIPNGKSIPYPWKRQIATIEIGEPDAITDNGMTVYSLLKQKGIKHLLVCGVHTNMCILNRTFAIKQMTTWGVDCALVRDCTDTMYNPRKAPFVAHAKGTELVIGYIEQNYCPSITSGQILGDAKPQKVLIITAEQEYNAKESLPAFAKAELEKLGFVCQHINSDDEKSIPGLEAMNDADVLMLFMRRRSLPDDQLAKFKAWFEAGKPVIGVRTASHGFQTYLEFDKEVLGGNYGNHYGKTGQTHITVDPKATGNPLLRSVTPTEWDSNGSLYKNTPLAATTTPLMFGKWTDKPAEPVAWTNTYKGGRVFYTSLGHADDFKTPQFRTLLRNAVLWAADREIPGK